RKEPNNRNILRSASTTRGTRPLSKEENSTASFLTRTRNPTGIYASLMKVARTMDIRQSVSFVSKFPGRWSELYSERRPNGVPCLTLDLRPTPRARLSLSVRHLGSCGQRTRGFRLFRRAAHQRARRICSRRPHRSALLGCGGAGLDQAAQIDVLVC